ncbi:MAG: hypothetical protein II709_08945, partial [Ruminococcus sp.]|nr:hypothetical protein [Ruminococcus sp.]
MKTKIKHLSKSTISMLLVLLMVISSVTAGIIATSAAIVDGDGNVGANVDSDSMVGMDFDASIRGEGFSTGDWNSDVLTLMRVNSSYSYVGTLIDDSVNENNKRTFKFLKSGTWYGGEYDYW